ncbi:4-alpha-glucanotransferase [Brucepastera parasyntrophica]|uniref:4-alpha-glucanotransferase n=1 Tax=Brucepastera parasyntrophica TaxID=2880008 RepID=UPI00210E85A1|nr:4-alpha-glucanotransferase [Brucepastera parasyntrophica]
MTKWIKDNPWIEDYAVFMNLKRHNFDASWKTWDSMRTPSHSEIRKRWENKELRADHLFFAWIQMRLDEQFSKAARYCTEQGIALKGDIPIMMNEDSCDAWANPEFFRDDLRAGSPPDGPTPLGQNWGFPIYNWDNLRNDNFGWWKQRLKHSARYYNAYRIDHILGFFRIWSIPYGETTGVLGWLTPHEPITAGELAERGFAGDRLRWITEPHVPTYSIEEVNNYDYLGTHGILRKLMDRIGNEELWLFKPEIQHDRDIKNADIPEAAKEVLMKAWRNRLLQITGRDDNGKPLYEPIWTYYETTAWQTLSDEEQHSLEDLFGRKRCINEKLWKDQADELLGELTRSVDMLACGEDLGTIPESVPEILQKYGIFGLKVIRWERWWNQPGQPFKNLAEYPPESVATSSVHDSSTVRGWWEQEEGPDVFLAAWPPENDGYPEGSSDKFRAKYTPDAAGYVLKTMARTSSLLLIYPLQDLLSLVPDYYSEEIDDERINVPGSVSLFNWTYRIPADIENLAENRKLISAIQTVLKERHARKINERGN